MKVVAEFKTKITEYNNTKIVENKIANVVLEYFRSLNKFSFIDTYAIGT